LLTKRQNYLDGPNSLVSVLEDLYYELYTSILSETTNWQVASVANAAKKVDDAVEAEALRNNSVRPLVTKVCLLLEVAWST
jgi:hypothetical protein